MSVRKRTWTTASGETREVWLIDYRDQNRRRHARCLSSQRRTTKKKPLIPGGLLPIHLGKDGRRPNHTRALNLLMSIDNQPFCHSAN
jgi:hypothetical protein